jgi:hypothetical protein
MKAGTWTGGNSSTNSVGRLHFLWRFRRSPQSKHPQLFVPAADPVLIKLGSASTRKAPLRRPWQALECVKAYGAGVVVRTNRAAAMPALLARLPFGSRQMADGEASHPRSVFSIVFSPNGDGTSVLSRNGRRVALCRSEEQLLDLFESQVALNVARSATECIFLHCGVVGWRGKAILIPGHTCYGKTTLVKHFLEAGAAYYSDEFAILDSAGKVHPYARPLQIRRQPGSLKQTAATPEELGAAGGTGREPIEPALLLCCRYREGGRWRPKEMTPGVAALELLRYSFTAYWSMEAAFRAASESASRLSAWRGARGEAHEVVEWALRHLDTRG